MIIDDVIEQTRRTILSAAPHPYSKDDLEELHLEFTYACNLRCRMCDVWKRYGQDRRLPRKEMGSEELLDYVHESRYLQRIRRVVVSGGEPLLKKDCVDLVQYFATVHPGSCDIGILSNLYNEGLTLTRLEEIHSRCGKPRLWIGTSLDGSSRTHGLTRGKPDAYWKFRKTLSSVRDRYPWIPISVNFTLTPENAGDLYAAYRVCRAEGLGFSVQFPVSWKDAETFFFSPHTLDGIEGTIRTILEEKVNETPDLRTLMPEIFYLAGLVDYERNRRRVFPTCGAGCQFVTISPVGDLYVCPPLKETIVGSLRHEPFDALWTSRRARKLRESIAKGRCHCWLNCTVYPNVQRSLAPPEVETTDSVPWWRRWKKYA